ncbi:MAG: 23S rRNA pseudouridine2457 synthase [Halieaceae bacterium]
MARLIVFNKPFQVLAQFTDSEGRATLAKYIDTPSMYPAGRLDFDSEGLLLLTDSGPLQQRISDPQHKMTKQYWVQVEGVPDEEAQQHLRTGVILKDGATLPALVEAIPEPDGIWERQPPIRKRQAQPTSWLNLQITEGRNRQVRRMTAAVGHPTLRLIRHRIGDWDLSGLAPGQFQDIEIHMPQPTKKPRGGRRRSRPKL